MRPLLLVCTLLALPLFGCAQESSTPGVSTSGTSAAENTGRVEPPAYAGDLPLGFEFVTSPSFAPYANDLPVAEHGSWNRPTPLGYRISRVIVRDNTGADCETFTDGWLQHGETPWGRPVDPEWVPDGCLLVGDDFAGATYRVYKQV